MPTATNLYQNIFEQIFAIELCKKELSKKMLLQKDIKNRQKYIYSFLNYDVNKHELLEHAAIVAYHNDEKDILLKISSYYKDNTEEDIINIIREEIKNIRSLHFIVKKQISFPQNLSFVEKRRLNDINKYVLEQARLYMQTKK